MPTTLEMAGIPIPEDVAFKSLLPVIAGEISYPAIYGAYKDKQRMILSQDEVDCLSPERHSFVI